MMGVLLEEDIWTQTYAKERLYKVTGRGWPSTSQKQKRQKKAILLILRIYSVQNCEKLTSVKSPSLWCFVRAALANQYRLFLIFSLYLTLWAHVLLFSWNTFLNRIAGSKGEQHFQASDMNCQMAQDKSRFQVTVKDISQGFIIFHRFLSFSSNYVFFIFFSFYYFYFFIFLFYFIYIFYFYYFF